MPRLAEPFGPRTAAALLTMALVAGATPLAAGPLNPPAGAVAPTSKPLADIEPRIAINDTNTPGDQASVYRITANGSYYLPRNVVVGPGRRGILILADSVTIDLMGYSLEGVFGPQGATTGIERSAMLPASIHIRNGKVAGFLGPGIDLNVNALGGDSLVENVTVYANGGRGIIVGANSVVRECHSWGNAGGIVTGAGATVDSCLVSENFGDGLLCGPDSSATDCTVPGNQSAGIGMAAQSAVTRCVVSHSGTAGIFVGDTSLITGCVVDSSGGEGIAGPDLGAHVVDCVVRDSGAKGIVINEGVVSGCTAIGNAGGGISAGSDSLVRDCSVRDNPNGPGIEGGGRCVIENNRCSGAHSADLLAPGILCSGAGSRIESNHCAGNNRGIVVPTAGNFIARNTCSGNLLNWSIASSNACLVVAATSSPGINGNSGGASPGSTDPNANFSH